MESKDSFARSCILVRTYVLIYTYPILALNIMQAFGCHDVEFEGERISWLRVDYTARCDDSAEVGIRYSTVRIYAAVWVILLVVGLPAYVLLNLLDINRQSKKQRNFHDHSLSFLLDDYEALDAGSGGTVLGVPVAFLWEFFEMIRKLLYWSYGQWVPSHL